MRLNSSFGEKTPKTATGVNKATLQLDTSPHICHFKAHYVTPWRYHSFILLFFHFSIYPFVHQAFSEYSGSVQGRWEGGKRERSLLSVPVLKLKSTERTTGFTYWTSVTGHTTAFKMEFVSILHLRKQPVMKFFSKYSEGMYLLATAT